MLSDKEKKALIRATWTPRVGSTVKLPAGRSVFRIAYMGKTHCVIYRKVYHFSKKGNQHVWTTHDSRTLNFHSYLFKGLRPVIDQ